ncbi:MAG: glycosyltransferase family 39 protein [Planctomycetales bacterium]|nr:glycosyltransferase family 39 protein [Planctomycetales bacterium]
MPSFVPTGPSGLNTSPDALASPSLAGLPDQSNGSSPSRSWWIFLATTTLVAAALRLSMPSGIAIEHFDEGVYASNLWCPDNDSSYPDRHLYAPPGLPQVIEEAHLWLGASDFSSIAPSLLAGIALIPLLGLLARDWLGEPAGRAAVLLAVFSDVHVLYSRIALTDVPWITCLVLAVWLIGRGLISGHPAVLLAAGLTTALGWWTKYTGWLPLAIGFSGVIAMPLLLRETRPPWGNWLKRMGAVVAVTAVSIAPLFVSLEDTGGYSAVTANHARYIVGLTGWLSSATSQVEHMAAFESPLTFVGVLVACWFANGMPRRFTWNAIRRRLLPAVAAGGLVAIGSFSALVLVAAGLALRDGLAKLRHNDPVTPDQGLAWTMLAAWWIAMTLTTPLYYPYPRLVLPWLVAGWLLVGHRFACWTTFGSPSEQSPDAASPDGRTLPVAAATGLVLLLLAIPTRFLTRGIPAIAPRTAISGLADQVIEAVSNRVPSGNAVIRIWGEPALFFQLSNRSPDRLLMQPAGGLQVIHSGEQPPDIPVFLIIGPHAGDGHFHPDALHEYEPVTTFEATPGLQVLRNQPPDHRDRPMAFRLYRWRQ